MRRWTTTILTLGMVLLAVSCRRVPQKDRVLEALAREVGLPLHAALGPVSAKLMADVDQLASHPTPASLLAARASWRAAAVAWRQAFAFREGPLVESSALLRAAYFPPNVTRVQPLLEGTGPITADHIEELGTDAKGLFVLDSLLFAGDKQPAAPAVTEAWTGPTGERRAQLARALARDVDRYGRIVIAGLLNLNPDQPDLARRYGEAGQASVNRLVNQMIETVEGVFTSRLNLIIGLQDSACCALPRSRAGPARPHTRWLWR